MDITHNTLAAQTRPRLLPKWLKPAHLLVAAGGALAIVHLTVWVGVLGQSANEQKLQNEVAVAQRAIGNNPAVTVQQLETSQDEAQAQLVAAQRAIPERIRTTTVTNGLFALALAHNVELVSLQSRPSSEQTVGQHRYTATPFTIVIRGKPDDMVAYLADLQTSPLQTLVTQMSEMRISQSTPDLALNVDIYTRAPAQPAATTGAAKPAGKKP